MQRELLTPILKPTILETFPLDNRSTIYLHYLLQPVQSLHDHHDPWNYLLKFV
jgi:hypothetical protein